MGMGHEFHGPAGSGSARPTGDPLQMTEAEKRVAEWEARHDVAARGRRAGGETVQHYVAHERLVHPAQPPHPGGRAAPQVVQPPQPVAARPVSRARSLLRRLIRRAG